MSNPRENLKNTTRERLKMKLKKTCNDKYKVIKSDNSSPGTSQPSSVPQRSPTTEDSRNIRDLLNFIEGKVPNLSYEKKDNNRPYLNTHEERRRQQNEMALKISENEKLLNVQKRLCKQIRSLQEQMRTEIAREKERQRQEALRMEELERKINQIRLLEEENQIKLEQQQSRKKKKKANSKEKAQKASEKPEPQVYNETINSKQVQYLADIVSQNDVNTGKMVTIKRVKCTRNETTVNVTLQGAVPKEGERSYTFVNGGTESDSGVTVEEVNTSNSARDNAANQQHQSTSVPKFSFTYHPFPDPSEPPIPCSAPPQTKTQLKKFKKAARQVQINDASQNNKVKLNMDLAKNANIFGTIQLPPDITVTRVGNKPAGFQKPVIDPADITITKIDSPSRNNQFTEYTPPPTQPVLEQSRVYVVDTFNVKHQLPGTGAKKEDRRKQKFKLIKGG